MRKKINRKTFFSFIAVLIFSLGASTGKGQGDLAGIYSARKSTAGGTGKIYMGREIAQVMGPANAAWLERNNRQQEENTNLAISKMPLRPSAVVADIGAGSGFYTFRIAPKVPEGKVYAVEIQDEMIALLEKRKEELKNTNVEIVKGDERSPNLPDSAIDIAIMVDVYHELLYPHEMLQQIRKSLRPNGNLLLLEYKAEDPAVAIRPLHKMSVAQVSRELAANGFTLVSNGDFLPIQHFLLFKKSKNELQIEH